MPNRALVLFRNEIVLITVTIIFSILTLNVIFVDRGYYDTMPQDLFGYYDGIYRVYLGQVPHRDFSTINGMLLYKIPAIFMKVGADITSSVRYYHVLLMLAAFGLITYIQRTRLEGFVIVPLATIVALVLACKYNFGDSPFQVTEAMFYNRIGFSFLLIEIIIITINKKSPTNTVLYADTFTTGILCGFLFYVKFTFGIAGLGFACLALIGEERTWQQKVILLSGSTILFALFVAILEFGMGGKFAWFNDIAMAMSSDSGRRSGVLLRKAALDIPEIFLSVFLPLAILFIAEVRIRLYGVVYAVSMLCVSLLLQLYSFQESVLLIPLAFILFCVRGIRSGEGHKLNGTTCPYFASMVVVYVVVSVNIAYPMFMNIGIASIRYTSSVRQAKDSNRVLGSIHTVPQSLEAAHAGKLVSPQSVALVESTPILDAYMLARKSRPAYYYDNLSFPEYEFYLRDGMTAVSKGCREGATIATLDFVNPFPALMGWPEGGGVLFVAPELISPVRHLSPGQMFRGIDCVLVPKAQVNPGVREFFSEVYGNYLKKNYVEAAETLLWNVLTVRENNSIQ